MQIYRHIGDPGLTLQGSVITLGNFDGIHLGHQALIGGTVAEAKQLGVPAVVLTFEPHPLKVLAPDRAPKMLLAHKDKMQLLQNLGVDIVVVQHFDLSFAKVSADEFVRELLLGRLKAKKIWVGRDLRFGQGRKGSVDDLVRWSAELGFQVAVVEPMLSRYHFVSGRVTGGHRRGRDLGFPTANISPRTEVLPLDGIYATLFHLGEAKFLSVSSVGLNPTFGKGPRTIESFVLNFKHDIYGEAVKLSFVKRIRDEIKFTSVEALIKQIRADVESAETMFRDLNLHA